MTDRMSHILKYSFEGSYLFGAFSSSVGPNYDPPDQTTIESDGKYLMEWTIKPTDQGTSMTQSYRVLNVRIMVTKNLGN